MESYRCVVATSVEELTPHREQWERLAGRALEGNAFLWPAFVEATLAHLGRRNPGVVFVYHSPSGRLVGVASFERARSTTRLPLATLHTAMGPHCYYHAPLLDRDSPEQVLKALWDWVERPGREWGLVRVGPLTADSPVLALARRELERRGRPYHAWRTDQRPILRRSPSFEAYLGDLSRNARKQYRRGRRRLEAAGELTVTLHRDLRLDPELAASFIRLEAMGWKSGEDGAALAKNPREVAFFEEATRSFADAGRLFFVEVAVDGDPVAMTTGFVAGETLFDFKCSYDPAFAAASPGIVAEIETVRAFHADPDLLRADAGTSGATYLTRYWPEATEMWVLLAATPSLASRVFVRLFPLLSRSRRSLAPRRSDQDGGPTA